MSDFHKFEIDINKLGFGSIKLDDKKLNGVVGINIASKINSVTTIKIEFLAENIKYKVEEEK